MLCSLNQLGSRSHPQSAKKQSGGSGPRSPASKSKMDVRNTQLKTYIQISTTLHTSQCQAVAQQQVPADITQSSVEVVLRGQSTEPSLPPCRRSFSVSIFFHFLLFYPSRSLCGVTVVVEHDDDDVGEVCGLSRFRVVMDDKSMEAFFFFLVLLS